MGKRVVVLGAGASRSARFPQGTRPDCLPPLNADFFTELQKISSPQFSKLIGEVVNDVVRLYGSNFTLTLEDYFTQLEFGLRVAPIAAQDAQKERAEIEKKTERLMHALHAVLESSTNRLIKGAGCSRHRKLVRSLDARDTIISFNYDCLIDDALRRSGNAKWNAATGYCFPSDYVIEGAEYWNPAKPATGNSIRLLKLHGSVNWKIPRTKRAEDAKVIAIKERIHKQHGWPQFTIIPPVWNKEPDNKVFEHIWGECVESVRQAEMIVVAGFSFSRTDLLAQALFRMALRDKHQGGGTRLKRLVIASPSPETRRHIRQIFDVPLQQDDVIVRQYDTFQDLLLNLDTAIG
jgi:hypothetical protein